MGQWNWLDGHTQRVAINGSMSKQRPMRSGVPVPQDLVFELVLLNIFAGNMDTGFQCTFNRFTNKKLGLWSSWHSGGKGCHPERSCQAWEVVLCKPCDVQQDQVQSLLSILGQTQAKIRTGQRMYWEALPRRTWKCWLMSAMHTKSPENQPCPGLQQKNCVQQVEGGDFPL